jgi:hypothetical protein
MMPAAVSVSKAMTATTTAAMMASAMPTTMTTSVPTSVPTAMAATMAATMAAALAESRTRQHAGERHHGNSNDRSQHRILPQSRAIEAWEIDWDGTGLTAESSWTATRQAATPPARSCRG